VVAATASVLLAAAAAGLLAHGPRPDRLSAVLDRGPTTPRADAGDRSGRAPLAACTVLAAALLLVLPLVLGLPAAALAVAAGPRLLGRLEPAGQRRRRERLAADLPLLLDLLAACLAGGASLPSAADAVAGAVGGPAGERLALVGAALQVGTPPPQAWALLAGDADDDPLAPAARALARAAEGGAPVASSVGRLAADARLRSRAAGEAAAKRVGVTAVAPLGLCFLPAFVLLGVVPVVAGLAGPLLTGG
jgi:pilus assembly protein TadC